jgi:NADH:ubiquinone oxidoreductase subunit 3 (subunit A)
MDYSNLSIMFVVLGFAGLVAVAWQHSVDAGIEVWATVIVTLLSFVLALAFVTYQWSIEGKKEDEKTK